MRAVFLLLVIAVWGSSCSSDPGAVDAASNLAREVGDPSEVAEVGSRVDSEDSAESETSNRIDGLDDDAVLAFENQDPADAVDEVGSIPSTTTVVTPESTELSRLVDELIVFVEAERGHRFSTRPGVVLLEGDEFRNAWNQLIQEDAERYRTDYDNFTDIYRAMGVIDGSLTLEEIWMRFGDAGVLGYYEADRKAIVLRAGDITPFTETVLVHELVHALDDQIFDIEREEYDDRTDEIGWTFSALVEGSAGVIEDRYRATLTQAERDEEVAVRDARPRSVSFSEFNRSFLELQFGRYRYGDNFAAALWEEGQAVIDGAFETPPTTSELVIDPMAFLAGQQPDGPIDAPGADGVTFHVGVWGEAGWAAVLADSFGTADALAFADGWGGDRYVAWRDGSTTCVRLHVEADSPAELDDYADALETWSRDAAGREVFYPTADVVRVTACG